MRRLVCFFICFALGQSAFAEDPSPFDLDLTPDSTAIEPVNRPPKSSLTQGSSPISSSIQNLNPDISFIGDFLGGNREALMSKYSSLQRPAFLREMEIDGVAYISPYAKGTFVASITEKDVSAEEVIMNFFELPGSFNVRIGKMLVDTDTLNPLHQHAIPFVDRPLIYHHFYGDEGLKTTGINASVLIPNPWDHYIIFSTTYGGNLFDSSQYTALYTSGTLDLPIYAARLGSSWDVGSISYLNVNGSQIVAPLSDGTNVIVYNTDALLRISPDPVNNAFTLLHGYLWTIGNPTQNGTTTSRGFYDYLGWQFSSRWRVGARYDESVSALYDGFEKQYVGILSFYPTETNYIRLQYARHYLPETSTRGSTWENRIWLQVDFSVGPHQQHTAL